MKLFYNPKSHLFNLFTYLICKATIDLKNVDEKTVSLLIGSFGGANLEYIAAPRCFEIVDCLKEVSDIPIFQGRLKWNFNCSTFKPRITSSIPTECIFFKIGILYFFTT